MVGLQGRVPWDGGGNGVILERKAERSLLLPHGIYMYNYMS